MVRLNNLILHKDEAGFSLLELLICVTVISASISLAYVGIKSNDEMSLRYECIRIIGELRMLHNRNQVNYKNAHFTIDRQHADGKFIIKGSNEYYIRKSDNIYIAHTLPKGMTIGMNRSSLEFNSNGTCTNTTITLKKNNRSMYIIIDMAGRIRLNYDDRV